MMHRSPPAPPQVAKTFPIEARGMGGKLTAPVGAVVAAQVRVRTMSSSRRRARVNMFFEITSESHRHGSRTESKASMLVRGAPAAGHFWGWGDLKNLFERTRLVEREWACKNHFLFSTRARAQSGPFEPRPVIYPEGTHFMWDGGGGVASNEENPAVMTHTVFLNQAGIRAAAANCVN